MFNLGPEHKKSIQSQSKHIMNKTSSAFIAILVLTGLPVVAGDKSDFSKLDLSKLPSVAENKGLSYAKDIKPILEASCFRCHGEQRPKGGLQLNSLDAVLKGGDDGKVVV